MGMDLKIVPSSSTRYSKSLPWQQRPYFLPLPQGQGAFWDSFLRGMVFCLLLQFVRRIHDFEIELEPFVGLDKLGQLLKGEEDAVHHDPTGGNSPP